MLFQNFFFYNFYPTKLLLCILCENPMEHSQLLNPRLTKLFLFKHSIAQMLSILQMILEIHIRSVTIHKLFRIVVSCERGKIQRRMLKFHWIYFWSRKIVHSIRFQLDLGDANKSDVNWPILHWKKKFPSNERMHRKSMSRINETLFHVFF